MEIREPAQVATLRRLGMAGGALAAVAFGFASWPAALAQTAGGRAQPLITQSVNDGNPVQACGQHAAGSAKCRQRSRPRRRCHADAAPDAAIAAAGGAGAGVGDADRSTARRELAELSPLAHGKRHRRAVRSRGVRHPTVTDWLTQHGFTVNTVYPNGMAIEFSGTAGQIRSAFHTEIHNLSVNGARAFRQRQPTRKFRLALGAARCRRHVAERFPAACRRSCGPNRKSDRLHFTQSG